MPTSPQHRQTHHALTERLSALLDTTPSSPPEPTDPGLLLRFPAHTFLIAWRSSSRVASVASALRALRQHPVGALPLVAVPFMGEAGAALCAEAHTGWLDLSGNAHIVGPGLRVLVQGHPNAFRQAGRPGSAFAPKSARITRWLLQHPETPLSQRELSEATGLDPGFTSRIVRRLIDDELVRRDDHGRLAVPRPDLLLDAWAEDYRFAHHQVHRGLVAARSGPELVARLTEAAAQAGVDYAFTGLAAAWQYTQFAGFRLATLYLPGGLTDALTRDLGVRPTERGANTWLVVPDDEGVMHGAKQVDGVRCVHPVQAWLDLQAQPERAKEAADRLREERLRWKS
jgi:hypothetical protein